MKNFFRRLKALVAPQTALKRRKSTKMTVILSGFYGLAILIVINVTVMALYFHDNDYDYALFNHAYIEAILPDQPATGTLNTGIVRIKEPKWDTLEAGDRVVTEDIDDALLGTGRDFPLVSQVLSKDSADETLRIAYDDDATLTIPVDDVIGLYQRDAGIIGSYYYSAMFARGYILHMISHILLLLGYYYVFIYDTPVRFLPEKKPSKLSKKR